MAAHLPAKEQLSNVLFTVEPFRSRHQRRMGTSLPELRTQAFSF